MTHISSRKITASRGRGQTDRGRDKVIADTENFKRSLQKQLTRIDKDLSGYRALLQERRAIVATLHSYGVSVNPRKEKSGGSVKDAIAEIMENYGQPLSPAQITRLLLDRGKFTNCKHPYANTCVTLRFYKTTFRRMERGMWFLVDAEPVAKPQTVDGDIPDEAKANATRASITALPAKPPLWKLISEVMWEVREPIRQADIVRWLLATHFLDGLRRPYTSVACAIHDGVGAELFRRVSRGYYTWGPKNAPPEDSLAASASKG